MPKIVIEGYGTFRVPRGKRLVRAIEENGIDILHRCGGHARCTTCRVEISEGEPARMTEAERDRLEEAGLLGQVRLSCQMTCEGDMRLRPLMTLEATGMDDPGPTPAAEITPEPQWTKVPAQARLHAVH